MNIPRRLRASREAAGLTQADIAEATGIAAPNLSAIESGRKDIRVSTLERLLDALELEIRFVPRDRATTLDDIATQAERGRLRLEAVGMAPSDPRRRLAAQERRGIDATVERRLLDSG